MMREVIGDAAMWEQLAEEATELAQAALKKARYLRQENPPRDPVETIDANIREEWTDVVQCAAEFKLEADFEQMARKTQRFLENVKKDEDDNALPFC